MNFSRQALLGIGMIIGGSVMLYAMVQQIGANEQPVDTPAMVEASTTEPVVVAPLTTDIETEKKLLAEKQKERAIRVAEQEARAQQFLAEQEAAEAEALAKARAENQRYIDNNQPEVIEEVNKETLVAATVQPSTEASSAAATEPQDTTSVQAANERAQAAQPEAEAKAQEQAAANQRAARIAAELRAAEQQKAEAQAKAAAAKLQAEQKLAEQKAQAAKSEPPSAPVDYTVKSGDGLIKLARQYNVPVDALAQANDISSSASLQLGQTITIPSRKQIQRLEREAAAAARKREQQKAQEQAKREAQKRLIEARKAVADTDAKGDFGVQVSLASNEEAAQRVAQKFKNAGYQVITSKTSRGVRVVVGPERGKAAALALKDKINNDPKVDVSGAWVKYW